MAQKPPTVRPVTVFLSYSHQDEALFNEFQKHLQMLKRQNLIASWFDREIGPDREWTAEIDRQVAAADLILLLLSPDYLASEECYQTEINRLLEQHKRGNAKVILIVLRPTDWRYEPFSKLQALPKGGQPVTTWPNRDQAFYEITQGIRCAVESISSGEISQEIKSQILKILRKRKSMPLLELESVLGLESVPISDLKELQRIIQTLEKEKLVKVSNPDNVLEEIVTFKRTIFSRF